jgi:uncharacterized repeat protein (TIGR04138 family)
MDSKTEDALRRLTERDSRYDIDAYRFVFESLDFTLKHIGRRSGHVSGRELAEGIKLYALDRFGGLAPMVFGCWGVRSTDDFGEIVFGLVDAELMGRTDDDTKDDFHNAFSFADAFSIQRMSLPPRRQRSR